MDSVSGSGKTEKVWATVGKVAVAVAILGGIGGLIKLSIELSERSTNAHLTGWVRVSEYPLSPELEDQFSRLDPFSLSNQIASALQDSSKYYSTLSNINEAVMRSIALADVHRQFFITQHNSLIHVRVDNVGSRPARDVKILLPGIGRAEVLSGPAMWPQRPGFTWTNTVPLGDISGQSGVELLIWPGGIQMWGWDPAADLTVVYSDGAVRLFRIQEFLGHMSDFVYWYDARLGFWPKLAIWGALIFAGSVIFSRARKHWQQPKQ